MLSVNAGQSMPNRIPIDPKLPSRFDDTPNEKRSKKQLDEWWDHPFGIMQPDGKILVRCLNGGAWDRSTLFGVANDYEEACLLAEKRQAEWVKTRAQPIFYHSLEPPFLLIQQPQRPDEEAKVVGSFETMDELGIFQKSQVQD